MPDSRRHRGPDPRDDDAFAPAAWPALRAAVGDLAWLLERGYAWTSALKLVGDRWSLTERQRVAVRRSTCSDSARARRLRHRLAPEAVRGQDLDLDGFNVLTTIEAGLGGAVVLRGRDECDRDLAGIHGTYRNVGETLPTLRLLGATIAALAPSRTRWLLDSPVSNSGRLRQMVLETAREHGWTWDVELVTNPDPLLVHSPAVVATADSVILDGCDRWLNLARLVIETDVPHARVVNLG